MNVEHTLSTNQDGRRAAAARDGRVEASDATTQIIAPRHTTGPWSRNGDSLEIRAGAGGKRIAYVSVLESIETARANAALIEAAPDLLATLVRAVNAMEAEKDRRHPATEADHEVYGGAMDAARAAIAKAEGRA